MGEDQWVLCAYDLSGAQCKGHGNDRERTKLYALRATKMTSIANVGMAGDLFIDREVCIPPAARVEECEHEVNVYHIVAV